MRSLRDNLFVLVFNHSGPDGFFDRDSGILVTSSETTDRLAITGGLQDQGAGYSANLVFSSEPDDSAPADFTIAELGLMIGPADPMMAFPAGTTFKPYSVLRNVSDSPVAVTPTLWWMSNGSAQSAQLAPVSIAAHQTQSVDLTAAMAGFAPKNFTGSFNVTYAYTAKRGSILSSSGSVDQTNTYVFEVLPRGIQESAGSSIQYWSTGNGDDTMVSVWNPADEPQDYLFTLSFAGGHYALPLHLEARATRMFNVSEIIENQVPDTEGNVIPAAIHEGSAVLSGSHAKNEQILVAADVSVYNVRKATCYGTCQECPGWIGASLVDSSFATNVGGTHQETLVGTWYTGSQGNIGQQYSSDNTPVATADASTGLVTGVSAGSANISGFSGPQPVYIANLCGNPPICPDRTFEGPAPGTVVSAAVTGADIVADTIAVTLSGPSGVSGNLRLEVTGANGQTPVDAINTGSALGPGNYTFPFQQDTIPIGEYKVITATWTVSGVDATSTFNYHFKVLGTFTQTQYNTPGESQCTGSPQPITVWNNSCVGTNTTVISGFDFRVTNPQGGTGSGHSIHWGDVSEEFTCSVGSGDLRSPFTIKGTLGGLSNATVAACSTNADLYVAGAQVYIRGEGVKTVTDRCPACCRDGEHLDNYNTSTQCSGLASLPSALTVRLY